MSLTYSLVLCKADPCVIYNALFTLCICSSMLLSQGSVSYGKDSSLESVGDHSTAITNLNRTILSMLLHRAEWWSVLYSYQRFSAASCVTGTSLPPTPTVLLAIPWNQESTDKRRREYVKHPEK